jgi:hypothetical protein
LKLPSKGFNIGLRALEVPAEAGLASLRCDA